MDASLDLGRIPEHVGIIMDGNGRWAKERSMIRLKGHTAGMEALREIVRHSQRLGVKYLTVYAFSTENWKRPEDEVSGIFRLVVKYVNSELKELSDNNVRVRVIGDTEKLPKEAGNSIDLAVSSTRDNTGLVFSIALNYGGRAEIIAAVNRLLAEGSKSVTEEEFSALLYTAGIPDPELIIRTGGEYRLSNFLTWQSSYSELVVTPVYWPDFTPEEYERCIMEYQKRDRRFGGIK